MTQVKVGVNIVLSLCCHGILVTDLDSVAWKPAHWRECHESRSATGYLVPTAAAKSSDFWLRRKVRTRLSAKMETAVSSVTAGNRRTPPGPRARASNAKDFQSPP